MPKPESGGKPKKITTKNPPGGPRTPGAKGTYPKKGKGAKTRSYSNPKLMKLKD
jgi:hypothetical protein